MGIIDYFTDEKTQTESGMSEEFSFECNTANANKDTVDWDGPVETAELAEGPKVHETEEGEEVVELGKFEEDSEVTDIPQDTMKVSREELQRHSAFFTEEELEELSKPEHHYSEETLSSREKVAQALDSPDHANTIEGLWFELAKEEERFGLGEEEELSEAEIDRRAVEAFNEQGYDVDHEHPDNMSIADATLGDLREAMQQDSEPEPEELSEGEEAEESGEEIETVSEELAQTASAAFDHYAKESGKGYWADLSEELAASASLPDSKIESTTEPGVKKITTQYEPLKEELMKLHNRDSAKTKVLDISGKTLEARAFEEDIQNAI